MSITELIKHVGEEHLACQWLETSLEHASIVKGQGYISFRTGSKRVMDIVNSTNPDRCLIIWFAQDRYPTEEQLTAAAASRAQATAPYADAYGVGLPPDTQANQPTKHNKNEVPEL